MQKFRVEQAELWRRDVRDLISLTATCLSNPSDRLTYQIVSEGLKTPNNEKPSTSDLFHCALCNQEAYLFASTMDLGIQDACLFAGERALAGHHCGTLVSRKAAPYHSSCSIACGMSSWT